MALKLPPNPKKKPPKGPGNLGKLPTLPTLHSPRSIHSPRDLYIDPPNINMEIGWHLSFLPDGNRVELHGRKIRWVLKRMGWENGIGLLVVGWLFLRVFLFGVRKTIFRLLENSGKMKCSFSGKKACIFRFGFCSYIVSGSVRTSTELGCLSKFPVVLNQEVY